MVFLRLLSCLSELGLPLTQLRFERGLEVGDALIGMGAFTFCLGTSRVTLRMDDRQYPTQLPDSFAQVLRLSHSRLSARHRSRLGTIRLVSPRQGCVPLQDGGVQVCLGSFELTAELRLYLLGVGLFGGRRGAEGGELVDELVAGSVRLSKVEAGLLQCCGELLQGEGGFGSGGVCLSLLRLRAALCLLGPRRAGVRAGDLLGRLTGHSLKLSLDRLRIPNSAELVDQDTELLTEVLDHPGHLPGDHARPLPRRIDGAGLDGNRALAELLPLPPCRRPRMQRIVAVLRRTPYPVRWHRRPLTPREPTRPLFNLLSHNVTIPHTT